MSAHSFFSTPVLGILDPTTFWIQKHPTSHQISPPDDTTYFFYRYNLTVKKAFPQSKPRIFHDKKLSMKTL